MSADIIRFGHQRLCGECENAYLGPSGVFCMEFKEIVDDETVAQECEAYDPQPHVVASTNGASKLTEVPETEFELEEEVDEEPQRDFSSMQDYELVEICDRMLKAQGITTWGRSFEVHSINGRSEAAIWLANQIRSVVALERPPVEGSVR